MAVPGMAFAPHQHQLMSLHPLTKARFAFHIHISHFSFFSPFSHCPTDLPTALGVCRECLIKGGKEGREKREGELRL